jgi:hypothetical protein
MRAPVTLWLNRALIPVSASPELRGNAGMNRIGRLQRACRRAFRAASASELPTSALMSWARPRGELRSAGRCGCVGRGANGSGACATVSHLARTRWRKAISLEPTARLYGDSRRNCQARGPLGKNSQSRIASHRLCRWLFVLHPSISAYPSARSDRKRGLAKLRLDGPLRSCGTRAGRQLQYCRALAIAQARD